MKGGIKMFNVGDTVQLKSGGPVMTVVSVNENNMCRCSWFKDEEVKESAFPADALEKYDDSVFAAVY